MALSNFVIPVKVDTSQVSKGLRNVSNQFKNLSNGLKSTGQALTLGVTAPLALLGREFVKTASDAEETQAKFSAVFKELTGDAEDFVQATADRIGRSTNDLRKFMGTLQDTFVPLGFAREEGLEFSKALTQLTLDLASFNNMAEAEVMQGLQSAIVGNHETMRKFGVIINQTNLNQELLNMGVKDGIKNATEAQKAQARLNIIMAGTADAQGDAERTAGSFANQTRRLQGVFEELAVELGNIIMPVIQKIITFFGNLITRFRGLSGETKILVVALSGIALALGPVMTALGLLISPIGLAVAGFLGFAKVIYDNSDTVIDNLVAIANNFINIYNQSLIVRAGVQSLFFVFKTIFNAIKTGIESIVELFSGFGRIVVSALKGDLKGIQNIFNETFTNIGEDVQGFGEDVANDFLNGYENVINGQLENITKETLQNGVSGGINAVKDFIITKAKELGLNIGTNTSLGFSEGLNTLVSDDEESPLTKLNNKFTEVKEKGQEMANAVSGAFGQFATNVVGSFELANEGANQFFNQIVSMMIKLIQMVIQDAIIRKMTNKQKVQDEAKTLGTIAGLRLAGLGTQAAALTAKIGLDQASATSSAIAGASSSAAATGPAAIFTQPAFIATMVGGVLAAFASIPKFAKGGIVTGPTLGLIGEAGAEAIIPLNKLDNMMGGGTKGEFILRGQDLVLALERADDFRTRITG